MIMIHCYDQELDIKERERTPQHLRANRKNKTSIRLSEKTVPIIMKLQELGEVDD